MNIEMKTDAYNDKRYGKPWIAKVNFNTDPKGVFTFGSFVGDPGYRGLVVIDAEPGEILAVGQKDHRSSRPKAPEYYEVKDDGSLRHLDSKAEAYKISRQVKI